MNTPTSKDAIIRNVGNGYIVTLQGVNSKPGVFTDTTSMLSAVSEYFNHPAVIPWNVVAGASTSS